MARPRIDRCTWSDMDDDCTDRSCFGSDGPQRLKDKELRMWVTYPDEKKHAHGRKKKPHHDRSKNRKLWAVVVIESLERRDRFTYEVRLRRVFKEGERFIRVQVTNDPADQSDEAAVFGFVEPAQRKLDSLEQYLCMAAAKRVYEAIAETWPEEERTLAPLTSDCQAAAL